MCFSEVVFGDGVLMDQVCQVLTYVIPGFASVQIAVKVHNTSPWSYVLFSC